MHHIFPLFSFSASHEMRPHDTSRQRITKSLFIRAYNCPLRLRHAIDRLPSNNDDNQYLRVLAEGGFQFEKLVRLMWRGQSLREASSTSTDAAISTLDCIRSIYGSDGVFHEAPFAHGDLLARVDMLRLEGKDLILCEIKAKAVGGPVDGVRRGAAVTDEDVGILQKRQGGVRSEWVRYVADVAFQTVVVERALRSAGITDLRVRPRLVLANREARSHRLTHFGNLRPKKVASPSQRLTDADFECVEQPPGDFYTPLVLEVDVEEAIRRLREVSAQSAAESWKSLTLEPLMDEMAMMLSTASRQAEDERGWKCRDCEFRITMQNPKRASETGFSRCWQGLADQAESLFELYRGGDYQPHYGRSTQRWLHHLLEPGASATSATIGRLVPERRGGTRAATRALQIESLRKGMTVYSEQFAERVKSRLLPSPNSSDLHFIDFETATACLPYEPGMRPYELIAFQFSSHSAPCTSGVIDRMNVRHQDWLDPMNNAPASDRTLRSVDRQFIDNLREAIGDQGPVLHWSAHERTVLRTLAARLDPREDRDRLDWLRHLAGETQHDHGRLVDMLAVAEGNVMTPHQQGRYSMKQLLPAACRTDHVWHELCELMDWQHHRDILPSERDPYRLLPLLPGSPVQTGIDNGGGDDEGDPDSATVDSHDGVRCGTDAIRAFQQLRYGSDSIWGDVDTAALRESLLEYCKLDTAAMVAVWVWLTDLAEHADRQ